MTQSTSCCDCSADGRDVAIVERPAREEKVVGPGIGITMQSAPRVLILEDDPAFRKMLVKALRDRGYSVEEAAAGAQAVQLARDQVFDLIITDIRMDGMDGLEALSRIKQAQPDTSSMVITGYTSEEDSVRAIRLGVGDYLKKPFRVQAFVDAVNRVLGTRRTAEASSPLSPIIAWGAAGWSLYQQALQPEGPLARCLPHLEAICASLGETLGLAPQEVETLHLTVLLGCVDCQPPAPVLEARRTSRLTELLTDIVSGRQEPAWDDFTQPVEAVVTCALEGLDWVPEEERPDANEEAGKRRNLLSLARALEERGDLATSREAYQEVARDADAESAVEALLGLAMVHLKAGDGEACRSVCLEGLERCADLEGMPALEARLEFGIFLCAVDPPRGGAVLGQLLPNLRGLGLGAHLARANLALIRAGLSRQSPEPFLDSLASPRALRELAVSVWWLVPLLLRDPESRLLRIVAREFPRGLRLGLALNKISPESLAPVAHLLAPEPEESPPRQGGGPLGLWLHSFGDFRVLRGEEELPLSVWRTRKTRYLLAYLASRAPRPVHEDLLLEAFWPEGGDKGRKNLFATVSHLRRILRPPGAGREVNYIVRRDEAFELKGELIKWHDLQAFREATERAASASGEDKLKALQEAAALCRGSYLEGYAEEWAEQIRAGIDLKVAELLTELTLLCQELGRPEEAAEFGLRALGIDPYSQPLMRAYMEACTAVERPDHAVRAFESFQTRLREDLDIEPSLELLTLFQRARLSLP